MSYYTVSKRTIIALALLLLSTLTATNTLAQNRKESLVGEEATQGHTNGIIEGTVLLQGRQDHSGTYIVVTNEVGPPNSELIVTDAEGFFSIDKPDGKYTVMAPHLRYLWSETVHVHPGFELPTVYLLGGDSNYDQIIDIRDLNLIQGSFGSQCSETAYRNYADINGDCFVNILDELVAGANLGNEGPMYWKTYPPLLSSTPAAVSLRVDSDDK